jgi:hypothetical protein
MMSSTARRCATSSRSAGPCRRSCHQKPARILSERPAMMLSRVDMPLNRATFWNVRAMPPRAASEGRIRCRVRPLKVIRPPVGW